MGDKAVGGKDLPFNRPMPAFGGVAGAKGDLQRAKEAGKDYDPTPFGSAWTHHFLNQKPWHPMNFKNRMRTWENEQRTIKELKDKERAQQEFDAEQEYRKTLSFLSEEQMQQHIAKQSVSFMYQKPPGYDAAMARDKEAMDKKAMEDKAENQGDHNRETATLSQAGPSSSTAAHGAARTSGDASVRDKVLLDPFKNILQARAALLNDNKLVMRSFEPTSSYGGIDPSHDNQKLILDQDDTGPEARHHPSGLGLGREGEKGCIKGDDLFAGLSKREKKKVLKRMRKARALAREKEEWEDKVRRAEEVLRQAGYQTKANG